MRRDLGGKSDIGGRTADLRRAGGAVEREPAGLARAAVKLAWKPALVDAPVASGPPQDGFATVTVVPDCDQTPFHPLLTLTVLPTVKVSRQEISAGPLLVIRTSAVNPVDHWLTV